MLFWKVLGRHHRHSDINACRNVYTYTQTIKKHKTLLRLTARLQARAPDIAAKCTRKCSRPKWPSLKNPRLLGACLGSSFSVLSRSASGQGRRPQVAPRSVQVAGRTSQLAGHRSHGAPRRSRGCSSTSGVRGAVSVAGLGGRALYGSGHRDDVQSSTESPSRSVSEGQNLSVCKTPPKSPSPGLLPSAAGATPF